MRVRAPDGRHAPVEVKAHGALFARGLGVHVDEDDLRLRLVEDVVHDEEGIIRVCVEREPPHEVDDADRPAAHGVFAPAAARALRREVRRTQDALFLLEIRLQLVARPRVVAERDDVGPGGEDGVGLLRRHADDVGVLAVDDGEINVFLLLKRAQALSQKRQAGRTHNVAHGQNTQDHADPSHAIGRKFDNRNSIPPTAAGNQSRNWRGADFIAFCPRAHTSRAAVQLRREAET